MESYSWRKIKTFNAFDEERLSRGHTSDGRARHRLKQYFSEFIELKSLTSLKQRAKDLMYLFAPLPLASNIVHDLETHSRIPFFTQEKAAPVLQSI